MSYNKVQGYARLGDLIKRVLTHYGALLTAHYNADNSEEWISRHS